MFHLTHADLINLRKFYRAAPRKFARAAANVMNSQAFGARRDIIAVINSDLTVRNEKFVSSSTRVAKTPQNAKFDAMAAVVGSVRRPRFSGWEEQQTGKKRKSTRVATLLARGGNESKQIKPAVRLKPSKDFPSPGEYAGRGAKQKTAVMLSTLRRKKYRKPFIMRKFDKFRPGLYKFLRNRIVKLQDFESKKAQPARLDWMGKALKKQQSPRRLWADAVRRVIK